MIDDVTAKEIAEKYYKKIYAYCFSHMDCDELTASEITQEVFLVFCEKCGELENENILAWLFTVAGNKMKEFYKKAPMKQKLVSVEEELTQAEEEEFFSLLDEYFFVDEETIEKHKEIILKSLSKKEQALYKMFFVENKKIKQVAKELNITENAAKLKKARLKKKLVKMVKLTLTTAGQLFIKLFL